MQYKALAEHYIYILTNSSRTLYVGVTNDLIRRIYEHRNKFAAGFTSKYKVGWLVYYEQAENLASAVAREKQIKGWRRSKKVELIEAFNPDWKDLSMGWYEDT